MHVTTTTIPPYPYFRIVTFGILHVERLIDVQHGTYAAVPIGEFGGNYTRIVLKSLLCSPTRRLRRATLLDRVATPDEEKAGKEVDPEKQAAKRLKNAVMMLRTMFSHPQVQESLFFPEDASQSYQLAGQHLIWVDADACQQLLDEAHHRLGEGGDPLALVKEAAGHFSAGCFLEDEPSSWVLGRRGTLEILRQTCLRLLVDLYERHNLLAEAEAYLRSILEEDYGNQEAYYRLIMVFVKQGKLPEALILADSIQERFAVEEGDEEEQKLIEATRAMIQQVKKLWRQQKQQMLTTITNYSKGNDILDTQQISHVPLEKDSYRNSGNRLQEDASGATSLHRLSPEQASFLTSLEELRNTMTYDPSRRKTLQKLATALGMGTVGMHAGSNSFEWQKRLAYTGSFQEDDPFIENGSLDFSKASVASLAAITQQFRAMQRRGETLIIDGVNIHIQTIQEALEQTTDDSTRTELWKVLAQTQIVAAFNPTKKAGRGRAKTLLEAAFASAQNSSDPLLTGAALGHLAQFSLREEQNVAKASQLLRRAQEYVQASHPLHGWFALVMASIAAKTGHEQQCEEYLTDAMTRAHHLPQTPEYVDLYCTDFGVVSAKIFTLNCWLTIEKATKAYRYLDELKLEELADNRRASAYCDASKACIMAGEFERAQQYAFQAINKAALTRQWYVIPRCLTMAQTIQQKAPDTSYADAITDYARSTLQYSEGGNA